jgi:hypothetical protein
MLKHKNYLGTYCSEELIEFHNKEIETIIKNALEMYDDEIKQSYIDGLKDRQY